MIKVTGRKLLNEVFVVSLVIVAVVLILNARNSSQLELIILVAATAFYLAWALIYHHLDKSLTLDVFMEYVLTALLALILLIGVLI